MEPSREKKFKNHQSTTRRRHSDCVLPCKQPTYSHTYQPIHRYDTRLLRHVFINIYIYIYIYKYIYFSLTHLIILYRRCYRFLHLVKYWGRTHARGVQDQRHVPVVSGLQRHQRLRQKGGRPARTTNLALDLSYISCLEN